MAVDYASLKRGGFMLQKQKDCFSLRLHIVGGHVSASQLAHIAKTAERFGDGYVHLTSRQSVEIPFIRLDEIDEVKTFLNEGDLAPGASGARVRTITACQGAAICPGGNIDTYALAKELDERYFDKQLPHKFKIGITGCQNNCLKSEENDIGIKGGVHIRWKEDSCVHCGLCAKICRKNALTQSNGIVRIDQRKCYHCGRCVKKCPRDCWDVQTGYLVSFGGLFGNTITKGYSILPLITDRELLLKICDTALDFFADNALAGERFYYTIQRVGKENFVKRIMEVYHRETAKDTAI